MRATFRTACARIAAMGLALLFLQGCAGKAPPLFLPKDQVALRYRIEQLTGKGEWKPVKAGRGFDHKDNIRFRFMSNVSGRLYVLNTSGKRSSLHPVFPAAPGDGGAYAHLGLSTPIGAGQVGFWPRPDQGSALRFTGVEGRERFLLVYVPDNLGTREMLAIPPGAEDWDFAGKTTYLVTGDLGQTLFHYFELKSE